VLRRVKLDEEERECAEESNGASWKRIPRSTRCDAYELPGLYAFCHDENFFRFSSRRSEPLREHVDVGEYKIHWAREVPNEMKDVLVLYLTHPLAEVSRVTRRGVTWHTR
jgi:hypothetical protein